MKIAITGSSGLVGTALTESLKKDGHEVFALVRRTAQAPHEISWDPSSSQPLSALNGWDAVVHLAGESLASDLWNDYKKARIHESRVRVTAHLSRSLAGLPQPPATLVAASAMGYYGNRGDEVLTEKSSAGTGFLANVCKEWEDATAAARDKMRVVNMRFGIVLSAKGGALKQMLPPFKWGVAGPLGSGRQYMSWISLDDAVGALRFAIERNDLSGPVNAVSPEPVTNSVFSKALGKALMRPAMLPMPSFVVRFVFGDMADEMLLASTRVMPARLTEAGFKFKHPALEPAINASL